MLRRRRMRERSCAVKEFYDVGGMGTESLQPCTCGSEVVGGGQWAALGPLTAGFRSLKAFRNPPLKDGVNGSHTAALRHSRDLLSGFTSVKRFR
ncbi:hypothetical protein GW17_00022941 [Ensete ventricosum]|nr:hypothetical protein GW17_00022941 [Ensete ventricosum]